MLIKTTCNRELADLIKKLLKEKFDVGCYILTLKTTAESVSQYDIRSEKDLERARWPIVQAYISGIMDCFRSI